MSTSTEQTERVMFFSRGKGRGHAIPDSAIAREFLNLEPRANLTFVSYSLGAETLKSLGWNTIDLGLPENNPLWDTVVQVSRVLQQFKPSLVVSHEEFSAMPLSKAMGLPTVFVTDWFANTDSIQMQSLKYADEVIFLDEPGYQDIPPYLIHKITYVGAVLRRFDCEGQSKENCRSPLGIATDSTVIVVVPGGATFHSEAFSPILDLVLGAYDLLHVENKKLIWVVGDPDYKVIAERFAGRHDLLAIKPHDRILWTMLAADLVITKGNRVSALECEALGIPSISISFGNNPIDDGRISRIRTNVALRARGLDMRLLETHIAGLLSKTREASAIDAGLLGERCLATAKRIRHHL